MTLPMVLADFVNRTSTLVTSHPSKPTPILTCLDERSSASNVLVIDDKPDATAMLGQLPKLRGHEAHLLKSVAFDARNDLLPSG